jgi:hypothetical protein
MHGLQKWSSMQRKSIVCSVIMVLHGAGGMAPTTLRTFGTFTIVYTLPEAASFLVALSSICTTCPQVLLAIWLPRSRRYFSYEHFYVIYCKFWELDSDHDFLIDKEDLLRYGNHALTYRIVDRIFAQVSSFYLWQFMFVLCLAYSTSALISGFRICNCRFEPEHHEERQFSCMWCFIAQSAPANATDCCNAWSLWKDRLLSGL